MEGLVYVDPAPRGDWALALAALLPRGSFARLALVATSEDVARDPQLVVRARARLAGVAAELEERVLPGPAESAVPRAARERRFGLLIVPPAGRGAIQRMLRGSRVASVVRSVAAPVLVARRPPAALDAVLGAVSGGALTPAVVAATAALARRLGVAPRFVHVASEVPLPFHARAGEAAATPPLEAANAVRAELARHGLGPDALTLREGLVVEEVLEEFERGAYPLLVVGARGEAENGWGREDVTERLLLRCPGSTLVVPPSGLAL